ncbi:MAG: MFS transporter [Asgard group archaeon]|nr:MFS transporter [Asgard group archaeon]
MPDTKPTEEEEIIEEVDVEEAHIEEKELQGNNKWLIWLISIFNLSSQNIFMQFYSIFARIVGVSATIIGFITSIRNLLRGLFQGSIGRLSDKIGRRYILLFGFFLSFAIPIPLLFDFAQNTYFLIFASLIQAFSISVVLPTWNAVLGDVTQPRFRAAFIGKVTAIGRIVSVAVTLSLAGVFAILETWFENVITIGGQVIQITWEIQYGFVFIVSSLNALLCIICVLFLKETNITTEDEKEDIPRLWVSLKDKSFVKYLIVNSVFGIAMSLIWPVNPIILTDVLKLTFPQVAIVNATFAIIIGVTIVIGGKIADKIGRRPLIIFANLILIFFPVSMIPAILTDIWWLILISRVIGGLGTGLNLVAKNAYTLDLAPKKLMGAYSGVREMFYGITTFIGSFASGFIIDALNISYDIITVAIIMSIGVSLIRSLASTGFLFIDESLCEEQEKEEESE